MIARIDLQPGAAAQTFDYAVSAQGDHLYADGGFASIVGSLAAAVEGMSPEMRSAEIAYRGVVSGTYPLEVIAGRPDEVTTHAVRTAMAVYAAEQG
jgi:hypothetical protein